MHRTLHIAPAATDEDVQAVDALFRAYAASLPIDLGYQDFEAELAGLPGQYAPPEGVLLLARGVDGAPLGCVALRAMPEPGVCEMKRLYVAPEGRGLGLGRELAETVVEAARRIGYGALRLDTLPSLEAAIALYASMGFTRTEAYYEGAPPGALFMHLVLMPLGQIGSGSPTA